MILLTCAIIVSGKKDTSLLDAFVGILYIIYSLFINLIAKKLLDIVQGVFLWSDLKRVQGSLDWLSFFIHKNRFTKQHNRKGLV